MTVRARVLGALRRVARLRPTRDVVAFGIPLPHLSAAAPPDDADFVWDARRTDALEPRMLIGFGETAAVGAIGDERIARVDRATQALFEELEVLGQARPRLLGGFAFDAGPLGAFAGFDEARFSLPRVMLTIGQRTEATVVVPRDELAHTSDLADEVAACVLRVAELEDSPSRARGRIVADGRAGFVRGVEAALAAIEAGSLDKVVLARAVEVETNATASTVLAELAQAAGCTRFCVRRRGASFVGATPELLVAVGADAVRTEAVAGTEPRRGHDLAEAARLLSRTKDLAEHRWVVDAIAASLERAGCTAVRHEPRVRTLAHVHHLVTPMTAPRSSSVTALGIAASLHPTPALGGAPRDAALAFIRAAEPVPRGLYAGALGWIGPGGEGELVVALRAAVLEGGRALAFAGAGIVRGSVPELEAQETDAKLTGMLRALGVAPAVRRQSIHPPEVGA